MIPPPRELHTAAGEKQIGLLVPAEVTDDGDIELGCFRGTLGSTDLQPAAWFSVPQRFSADLFPVDPK